MHQGKTGEERMSYREIAIQDLREQYPDIVRRPDRYRTQIAERRERVKDGIAAANRLWEERLGESPTDE